MSESCCRMGRGLQLLLEPGEQDYLLFITHSDKSLKVEDAKRQSNKLKPQLQLTLQPPEDLYETQTLGALLAEQTGR